MPISATCPECQSLFDLPDDLAGQEVRCQKCEQLFTVPEPAAEVAEPTTVEPEQTAEAPESDAAPVKTAEKAAVKPKNRLAPKEGWAGTLVSLALLLMFSMSVCGIGTFAGVWIATHLSPPARGVVVPPLPLEQKVNEIPKMLPK